MLQIQFGISLFEIKRFKEMENQWPIQDFRGGGGAPTSDAGALWQKHAKTKEWDLLGATCWWRPLGSINENERKREERGEKEGCVERKMKTHFFPQINRNFFFYFQKYT